MDDTPKPLFNDKVYDVLTFLVKVVLPGISTLYFTLGDLWGLPYVTQIVGTLAATAVFLGLILQYSKKSYNASDAKYDGSLKVDTSDPLTDKYNLEVAVPFEELASKKQIILKVQHP